MKSRSRKHRALMMVLLHADASNPVPCRVLARYVEESMGDEGLGYRAIRVAVTQRLLEVASAERGTQRLPGVKLTAAGARFVESQFGGGAE